MAVGMRGLYELPLSPHPQKLSIGLSGNPDDVLTVTTGSLADRGELPIWMRPGRASLYEGPRLIGYVRTLEPVLDDPPLTTRGSRVVRGYDIEFVRAIGPAP